MRKLTAICLTLTLILLSIPLSGCNLLNRGYQFEPSKVSTHALWAGSDEDGKAIGGTSKLTVEIEKKDAGKLEVSFTEDEVAGTGDQWRASGWSAALATSLLLGVDLTDYAINYHIEGKADGPSAGGLTTVATLASFLGEKIKKDHTMTGTINIDGSIGPVGGIAHKIDGAKAAGKKVVLIPTGERFSIDNNTQKSVDVVTKGSDLGIEVKEVSDIYEAYEELVGKPLPKPEVSSSSDPELPESSISEVKAKAQEWYSRYQETSPKYNKLSADIRKEFNASVYEADDLVAVGNKHYDQGMFASAYGEITEGTNMLDMIYASAKSGDEAFANVLSGEEAALDAASEEAESLSASVSRLDSLSMRLKEKKAESLGDTLAIAEAYGQLLEGNGVSSIADSYYETANSGTFAQKLQSYMMAAYYYAAVPNYVDYTEDFLEIGTGSKGAEAPSQEQIRSLSEILRKAAEANINTFEATIVKEYADQLHMSEEDYKESLRSSEPYYAFATALLNMSSYIKKKAGSGQSGDYATLGAAISSYTYSSYLMAKYYSLGARVDTSGKIVSVDYEKALIEMLDYNIDHTKENIEVAKKSGGISPFPIINYEKAKADREGTTEQKMNSLIGLWRANLEAQMMTMLSQQLELVPSEKDGQETLEYSWKDSK